MIDKTNINRFSISDTCGNRVLNMGGSLTGYIHTGNPYHKDYYVRSTKRTKNSPENNTESKTKKFLKDTIPYLAATAGTIAACVLGAKYLPKAATSIKEGFSKLPKLSEVGEKIKAKVSDIHIKDKLSGAFEGVKKFFTKKK